MDKDACNTFVLDNINEINKQMPDLIGLITSLVEYIRNDPVGRGILTKNDLNFLSLVTNIYNCSKRKVIKNTFNNLESELNKMNSDTNKNLKNIFSQLR